MTPDTLAWGRMIVARKLPVLDDGTHGDIVEIGARNVNGSYRDLFTPRSYVGIDIQAGPGVDLVMNARDLVAHFGHARFDIVVCTETIEHIRPWQGAIWGMKAACRVGGVVIVTTRAPGFPRHEYPSDYWRFTRLNLVDAFDDFNVLHARWNMYDRGVYVAAQRISDARPTMPSFGVMSVPDE